MVTKIKINISVDKEVHKDIVKICGAIGMKVSTFVDRLFRSFLSSEKLPGETIEEMANRMKREYQGGLKF